MHFIALFCKMKIFCKLYLKVFPQIFEQLLRCDKNKALYNKIKDFIFNLFLTLCKIAII